MTEILVEPHVNKIVMPDNLEVGLMIADDTRLSTAPYMI